MPNGVGRNIVLWPIFLSIIQCIAILQPYGYMLDSQFWYKFCSSLKAFIAGRYTKGVPSCSLAAPWRFCSSPLAVTAAIARRRNPNALRHRGQAHDAGPASDGVDCRATGGSQHAI